MVSLKMVQQTPKHVGGNWWYIYIYMCVCVCVCVFNVLCAFSWNKKEWLSLYIIFKITKFLDVYILSLDIIKFTLAKNATKPNPFEIIPLQTTRKENNWKTEEALVRAAVTLETERIKGFSPLCFLLLLLLLYYKNSDCKRVGTSCRIIP